MRRLFSILVTTTLALAACAALAHAAVAYNSNVTGSQTASAESEGVLLRLNASGDIHGMLDLKIKREGGNVVGGSWTLTVLPPNADATSSERGRLSGVVSGGTLTADEHGVVSAASAVQLSVEGGTGDYAAVSAGSGTVSLSSDAENPSRLGGPLALNF